MRVTVTPAQMRALLRLAELDARPGAADASEPLLRQQRAAAQRNVPPVVLERYQVLFARGRSPVITAAVDGCCSGCHVRLPATLEYEIRKAPVILACPHCHRILYGPGHLAEASGGSLRGATGAKGRSRRPQPTAGKS